jgi:hypothetical protein
LGGRASIGCWKGLFRRSSPPPLNLGAICAKVFLLAGRLGDLVASPWPLLTLRVICPKGFLLASTCGQFALKFVCAGFTLECICLKGFRFASALEKAAAKERQADGQRRWQDRWAGKAK